MWKLVQYSRQGRGHVKNNVPCQDKTYVLEKGRVSAIVLADGAGSAKLSHKGAEAVTKTIAELLCDNFEDFYHENDSLVVKDKVFSSLETTLSNLSSQLKCNTEELASTLLAIAATDDEYIIFHLGDGVIGYLADGKVKVASIPNNGEFCNTTVFTTSRNAESQTKLYKGLLSDRITGFVAFSDGVESCLYNHKDNTINDGIEQMFDDLEHLPISEVDNSLAEMFDEVGKCTMDDCSLVAMVKSNVPVQIDEHKASTSTTETETEPSGPAKSDMPVAPSTNGWKWNLLIILVSLCLVSTIILIILFLLQN